MYSVELYLRAVLLLRGAGDDDDDDHLAVYCSVNGRNSYSLWCGNLYVFEAT